MTNPTPGANAAPAVEPAATAWASSEVLDLAEKTPASPGRRMVRRFLKNRLAVIGLLGLIAIILLAVFAAEVQRFPYEQMDLRASKSPPSSEHWLGTDRIGRDIWSRTIHGGRVSLAVAGSATLLSTVIGLTLGSLAGYYGGWGDMVIMRFTDVVMTLPAIVIMITIATFLPRTLTTLVIVIGGLSWPGTVRLVRGQFLSFREQEFVTAARCIGTPNWRIITIHILPNVIAPMVAMVSFTVGNAILTEAGLSFLGLGVAPPTPSWGNMLEAARNLEILQQLPWMWIPPAILTVLTVLFVNMVGDGLRDAADPRMVM